MIVTISPDSNHRLAKKSVSLIQAFPSKKPRLLLICDTTEQMRELQGNFEIEDVEIVSVGNIEELQSVCNQSYKVAALDVSAEQLPRILNIIRNNYLTSDIPVLVHAARLTDETNLAGVLPRYRAMPCSISDLLTLIHRQIAPSDNLRKKSALL